MKSIAPKLLLLATILSSAHHAQGQASETSAPTPTPAPNECDEMIAGDTYFYYVQSADPDEVTLFLFEDIPGNIKIYLTDNAWTGTGFQSDEGTLEMTTPASGIPMGSIFGYGPNSPLNDEWELIEGAFALSEEGEQVFLYCYGSKNDIVPLAAISYNGDFQPAGRPSYGFNESALPDRLATNGTIALPHCDTWEYKGTQSGETDVLRQAIQDTSNWRGRGQCTGGSSAMNLASSVLSNLIVVSGLVYLAC